MLNSLRFKIYNDPLKTLTIVQIKYGWLKQTYDEVFYSNQGKQMCEQGIRFTRT